MSASLPPSARPIAASAQNRIKRVHYDENATLKAARDLYFAANGFPADGGYDAAWVDFALGPIPMPFPNSDGRRRAVKVHDLHHVLTGYATDIYGEAEISSWELAAGCGNMVAAWILNFGGMALGMLIAPRRTFRAWVRGRQTRSLYRTTVDDALLSRTLSDVRQDLGLDAARQPARLSDVASFFFHWQIGAWGSIATIPFALLSALGAAGLGLFRKRG